MTFLLISATPPEIAEHPVDLTVPRGSPATLHCVAAGSPEPTITWLREDGGPVTPEGDHTVQLPDGSLFFLRTVQNPRSQDSGLYSCRAENRDGVVQSRPARLTVTCKYCSLSSPHPFQAGLRIRIYFWSGSVSSILGWILIRIQWFWWPKIGKNLQLKKKIFYQKLLYNLPIPRPP